MAHCTQGGIGYVPGDFCGFMADSLLFLLPGQFSPSTRTTRTSRSLLSSFPSCLIRPAFHTSVVFFAIVNKKGFYISACCSSSTCLPSAAEVFPGHCLLSFAESSHSDPFHASRLVCRAAKDVRLGGKTHDLISQSAEAAFIFAMGEWVLWCTVTAPLK